MWSGWCHQLLCSIDVSRYVVQSRAKKIFFACKTYVSYSLLGSVRAIAKISPTVYEVNVAG